MLLVESKPIMNSSQSQRRIENGDKVASDEQDLKSIYLPDIPKPESQKSASLLSPWSELKLKQKKLKESLGISSEYKSKYPLYNHLKHTEEMPKTLFNVENSNFLEYKTIEARIYANRQKIINFQKVISPYRDPENAKSQQSQALLLQRQTSRESLDQNSASASQFNDDSERRS